MKSGIVWVVFLYGCGTDLDKDKDGFTVLTGDCDEGNPNIHPAAVEICDEIDNDCNGEIDELGARGGILFYADIDGDGHGSSAATLEACSLPEGYSTSKRDCNEGNPNIHPDADEICDGEDNDCDTLIDEYTAIDAPSWHPDLDGDGYGDANSSILGCEAPPDYILDASDCDDIDPNINPDAREDCETVGDENCNGSNNDENADGCTYYYADIDGDGFFGTGMCLCEPTEEYTDLSNDDCDDSNPNINPAQEDSSLFSDLDCTDGSVYPLENAAVTLFSSDASHDIPDQLSGGDYNGDGYADIVIGDANTDTVHIFYGPDIASGDIADSDVTITGHGDWGSYTMTTMDHNADGIDDLVLTGGESYDMTVYLFQAPFSQTLTHEDAVASIAGDISAGYQQIRSLGDFNGDGYPDLLWNSGTPHVDGVGVSVGDNRIYYGPMEGERQRDDADFFIQGEGNYDQLGGFSGAVGDLNGDGLGDIALGSEYTTYSSQVGSIRLYFDDTLLLPDTVIGSNTFYANIAFMIADKTDFNGDGHNDLVFSARYSQNYIPHSGRVHVLHGPFTNGNFELLDMGGVVIYGEEVKDRAKCIQAAGDIDADGRDDLLIASENDHAVISNSLGSAVYVYFGEEGEGGRHIPSNSVKIPTDYPLFDWDRNSLNYCQSSEGSPNARQGRWYNRFVSPGDVNGDGYNDILISAKRTDESDPDTLGSVRLIWGQGR